MRVVGPVFQSQMELTTHTMSVFLSLGETQGV